MTLTILPTCSTGSIEKLPQALSTDEQRSNHQEIASSPCGRTSPPMKAWTLVDQHDWRTAFRIAKISSLRRRDQPARSCYCAAVAPSYDRGDSPDTRHCVA